MLKYLFGNSDLSALTAFVTPNFFSVLRLGDSARIGARLYANHMDSSAWVAARQSATSWLDGKVRICQDGDSFTPATLGIAEGEALLELFFLQILRGRIWILDFRADRWGYEAEERLAWKPAPYFYEPSPDFRNGVVDLYSGFYQDDRERFQGALQRLGLEAAEVELRKHFGLGGQRQVQFRLADFQRTFAGVFSACERAGSRIDAEFGVLGLMLLTLYSALDPIGAPLNARRAFERAWRRVPAA